MGPYVLQRIGAGSDLKDTQQIDVALTFHGEINKNFAVILAELAHDLFGELLKFDYRSASSCWYWP